jgi:hypothetical protein
LPLLFFVFVLGNLALWPYLHGIPLALYLATVLTVSFRSAPGWLAARVFLYAVGTHFAYSLGMVGGLVILFGEAFWPRKRLVPMPHRPKSLEEI